MASRKEHELTEICGVVLSEGTQKALYKCSDTGMHIQTHTCAYKMINGDMPSAICVLEKSDL